MPDIELQNTKQELAKYQHWVQELRAKDALTRSLLEDRTDGFQRAMRQIAGEAETTDEAIDLATMLVKNHDLRTELADLKLQMQLTQ